MHISISISCSQGAPNCNSAGVLDLQRQTVTHVHCPPPVDGMAGLVSGQYGRSGSERQQPCWMPNGASFCVGEAAGTGLHILDFHPSLHSPCHVGEMLFFYAVLFLLCKCKGGTSSQ